MIDVKETLNKAGERMEMASMYRWVCEVFNQS